MAATAAASAAATSAASAPATAAVDTVDGNEEDVLALLLLLAPAIKPLTALLVLPPRMNFRSFKLPTPPAAAVPAREGCCGPPPATAVPCCCCRAARVLCMYMRSDMMMPAHSPTTNSASSCCWRSCLCWLAGWAWLPGPPCLRVGVVLLEGLLLPLTRAILLPFSMPHAHSSNSCALLSVYTQDGVVVVCWRRGAGAPTATNSCRRFACLCAAAGCQALMWLFGCL